VAIAADRHPRRAGSDPVSAWGLSAMGHASKDESASPSTQRSRAESCPSLPSVLAEGEGTEASGPSAKTDGKEGHDSARLR